MATVNAPQIPIAMKTTTSKMQSTVKSASRALELLAHFDQVRRPLPLNQIVAALGYPVSSAAVLLRSLVTLGYLHHDRAARTYMPSLKVARLASWVGDYFLEGDADIAALVARLQDKSGETIIVAVRNSLHVQYVHVASSRAALQFVPQIGAMRPLWQTPTGWCLMSRLLDEEIESLVKRSIAEFGTQSGLNMASVKASVEQVRKAGFAYSANRFHQGVGIIAAPLLRQVRGMNVAMGIGGPTSRLDRNEASFGALLRTEISAWDRRRRAR